MEYALLAKLCYLKILQCYFAIDTATHISPKKALYAGPIRAKADGENGYSEMADEGALGGQCWTISVRIIISERRFWPAKTGRRISSGKLKHMCHSGNHIIAGREF